MYKTDIYFVVMFLILLNFALTYIRIFYVD